MASRLRSRSPLALGKRAGGAIAGFVTSPIRDSFGEVGTSVRTERDLRAVPIGPARRQLGRVYSYALYGVAILVMLAFFNNRQHFAGAVLLAAALGAMYIVWSAHRALFLTAGIVIWWAASAPFIALLTSDDAAVQVINMRLASATPLLWATGAGVWLVAIVARVRRPWLLLTTTWIVVFASVFLTARYWNPDNAYYVAWGALALYLGWRCGMLVSLWDFVSGRANLGHDYAEATEVQYEVYKELNSLPRGYRILRQLASSAVDGANGVDALVAGPTGLFYIAGLPGGGEITVAAGRPRRVLVKKKAVDAALLRIARTARSLRRTLDLDMTTIVTIHDAEWPNRGLLAVKVRTRQVGLTDAAPDDVVEVDEAASTELRRPSKRPARKPRRGAAKRKSRPLAAFAQLPIVAGKAVVRLPGVAVRGALRLPAAVVRGVRQLPKAVVTRWRRRGQHEPRVFDAEAAAKPEALTLLDPVLLRERLEFGPAVYTAGQLARVTHRIRKRLEELPRKGDEAPTSADESDTTEAADAQLALR